MTVSIISVALDRLTMAPPESPLAFFSIRSTEKIDAVFAATIESQKRIKAGHGLIGIFDMHSDIKTVKEKIKNHALKDVSERFANMADSFAK